MLFRFWQSPPQRLPRPSLLFLPTTCFRLAGEHSLIQIGKEKTWKNIEKPGLTSPCQCARRYLWFVMCQVILIVWISKALSKTFLNCRPFGAGGSRQVGSEKLYRIGELKAHCYSNIFQPVIQGKKKNTHHPKLDPTISATARLLPLLRALSNPQAKHEKIEQKDETRHFDPNIWRIKDKTIPKWRK